MKWLGGNEGIKQTACSTISKLLYAEEYKQVTPDFEVTFCKSDFDFVDIYVSTQCNENPQDKYDQCEHPIVLSAVDETK